MVTLVLIFAIAFWVLGVNWLALATIVYALVAGLLLLRLAVGLYLTWRLARAAKPMRADRDAMPLA